jgi:serine/threonine-protein kinase
MRPALGQDADTLVRFRREAEQASWISHPNVVAIYDFGDAGDGLVFLAMEFIEGESLADRSRARDGSRLPRRRTSCSARRPDSPRRTGAESSIATSSRRTSCSPPSVVPTPRRIRTPSAGTVKLVDFEIARWIMGDIIPVDAANAAAGG